MDISNAFNAPVIVTLDGADVSFLKFSPPEIAIECERLKAHKVDQANRLVDKFSITGLEALKVVRQAEDEEPTINALWAEACTPKGGIELLVKALKKSGKSETDAKGLVAKLDPEKLIDLALRLTGYKFPEAEEEKPVEKKKKGPVKTEEAVGFSK